VSVCECTAPTRDDGGQRLGECTGFRRENADALSSRPRSPSAETSGNGGAQLTAVAVAAARLNCRRRRASQLRRSNRPRIRASDSGGRHRLESSRDPRARRGPLEWGPLGAAPPPSLSNSRQALSCDAAQIHYPISLIDWNWAAVSQRPCTSAKTNTQTQLGPLNSGAHDPLLSGALHGFRRHSSDWIIRMPPSGLYTEVAAPALVRRLGRRRRRPRTAPIWSGAPRRECAGVPQLVVI
jgi:hypothetical protein